MAKSSVPRVSTSAESCVAIPDLHLLYEMPRQEPSRWLAVLSGSVALHIVLFFIAIQLPTFGGRREPERQVPSDFTPLYLPPDVLTQKATNRKEISKNIDLASLLETRPREANKPAPAPRVKRFEMPKQETKVVAKNTPPQILPEAPKIALNQTPGPALSGSLTGIGAPAPP